MTMSRRLVAALGLLLLLVAAAESSATDLALYDSILQRHTREVSDAAGTRVDYAALKTSEPWRQLVASLTATDPTKLRSRSGLPRELQGNGWQPTRPQPPGGLPVEGDLLWRGAPAQGSERPGASDEVADRSPHL